MPSAFLPTHARKIRAPCGCAGYKRNRSKSGWPGSVLVGADVEAGAGVTRAAVDVGRMGIGRDAAADRRTENFAGSSFCQINFFWSNKRLKPFRKGKSNRFLIYV
jgi:hypothetical protein